ncbi:MAG: AAA family ATPase [Myxococcales bacterium]|nr:AAA family ATPase [Myxococcales bacterium]
MGQSGPPDRVSSDVPEAATVAGPVMGRGVAGAAELPTVGVRLGGRYETLGLVGAGGGGVVFRARDAADGSLVALKVSTRLDGGAADAFEREARVLAQLQHPAIVKYLDHGTTPEGAYLAMELLAGETLRERLAHGPLAPEAACRLGARMLDALGFAHARGVVHRDFKPSNVFLPAGQLEQAKLLDFGIARELYGWARTLTGQVMGTPLYMAPEQATGRRDVDGRADLFAVGCVLVECITGRPLFAGVGTAGLAKLALADDVLADSDFPHLPPALGDVLRPLLARDPAHRPSDARAVARQLESLAGALQTVSAPAEATALGSREARSMVVLMVGAPQEGASSSTAESLVADLARRHQGHVQTLLSGALLVSFGPGGSRELATLAARAALALRPLVIGRALALALGRATVEGRTVVSAAIDETTRLLAPTPDAAAAFGRSGVVYVDSHAAALLADGFEVESCETAFGTAHVLRGEQAVREGQRLLLGREVPFVGRERELASLEALVLECFDDERAHSSLVVAPAGGGKSRLKRALRQSVSRANPQAWVLVGQADPLAAGAPYGVLAAALRRAAQIAEPGASTENQGRLRALLAEVLATSLPDDRERILAFIGEIMGVWGEGNVPLRLRSARQDPRSLSDQVRLAWLDLLAGALARGPVFLVLEDLHWADGPSLQLAELALRTHRDRPLFVLGFARPEVNDRFPNLWRDVSDRQTLPPLRPRACRELVRAVLPDLAPERLELLVARADGNPFFLEELLRVESQTGAADERLVPPTILAALQTRLDTVGEGGKQVLRAASVFGERFSREGVEALLPQEVQQDVEAWLDVLASAELVARPLPPGAGHGAAWQFRHALVRDAAYDTLLESDKRVGHRLAARHLAATGEREGALLAAHYELAGDRKLARHHYRVAAEQALEAGDAEGVKARCAQAQNLGAAGEELGWLRLVACRAVMWQGAWPVGEELAREAYALLPGLVRIEALTELIIALGQQQKTDEMRARFRELMSLEPQGADRAAWAYAALRSGGLFVVLLGERTEVVELVARTRQVAALGDLRLSAMWHNVRSQEALMSGAMAQCQHEAEAALAAFETAGDIREACGVLNNLVCVLTDLGKLERAERRALRLLALSERLGLYTASVARVNLACIYLARGEAGRVAETVRQAMASEQVSVDPRVQGFCHLLLAQAALAQNRPELAVSAASEAVSRLAKAPAILFTAEAALSRALLQVGQRAEARIYAQSAVASLERGGVAEHAEFMVWLAGIEVARADGDTLWARTLTEKAAGALDRRLMNLTADEDRERALSALPDVALIERHARALGVAFPRVPHVWIPSFDDPSGVSTLLGDA